MNDQTPRSSLKLSVREFVSLQERTGSLQNARNFAGVASPLQAGTLAHQLLQAEFSEQNLGYSKEVYLSDVFESETLTLEISGRIDGLYEQSHVLVVEEIKSTAMIHALKNRLENEPLHPYVLQVKTYAYLYWRLHARIPRCRLLIVSLHDTDERFTLEVPFELGAYQAWFEQAHQHWAELKIQDEILQQQRVEAGLALHFPFETLRAGQEELVRRVATGVRENKVILLQAPTGLGKTVGVLYPALQDALLHGRQVFYVTPKNSQHRVALDTMRLLRDQGNIVRALSITSKEKACLKEERICDPQYCEFARGYYDKLTDHGVLDKLADRGILGPEDFEEAARTFEVCPFELSLDMTSRVDVVVCDYNYVFSPRAALQRFFEEDRKTGLLNLVVDEAHNLYARALDEYSPQLSFIRLHDFAQPISESLEVYAPKLIRRAQSLVSRMMECVQKFKPEGATGTQVVTLDEREFFKLEKSLGTLLVRYSEIRELLPPSDPLVLLNQYWLDFCTVLRMEGSQFVFTYRPQPEGDELQITCCDASAYLAHRFEKFSSVVAFSATIKPFEFYAKVTGLESPRFETAEFESPFPRENRKILVIPQISTAYRDRQGNYGKIAEAISRILAVKPGNYFVFFPSFEFLEAVFSRVTLENFRLFAQTRKMSNRESGDLLKKLNQKTRNVVIFGVQGGVFAEGIDCPGDSLIGAIVVGPALPAFHVERECIRKYYDTKYGRGFDYAYTYPAMARVVQAAGRVIRTETDRGLIVLMDKRFTHASYSGVMPRGWFDASVNELVSRTILNDVHEFWQEDAPHEQS